MTKEICTIRIILADDYDREFGPELEDVVKNAWGYMTPWFTRRHGIRNGSIRLQDDAVTIEWSYDVEGDEDGKQY